MSKSNKTRGKGSRIVRYNKKKVFWISFVVIAIIVGVSLGIYYGTRPKGNPFPRGIRRGNWRDARRMVADAESEFEGQDPDDPDYKEAIITGVFFGATDSTDYNHVIYGDAEDKSSASGAFSYYLEEAKDYDEISWIAITDKNTVSSYESVNRFLWGTTSSEAAMPNGDDGKDIVYLDGLDVDVIWDDWDNPNNKVKKVRIDNQSISDPDEEVYKTEIGGNSSFATDAAWFMFKNGSLEIVVTGLEDPDTESLDSKFFHDLVEQTEKIKTPPE